MSWFDDVMPDPNNPGYSRSGQVLTQPNWTNGPAQPINTTMPVGTPQPLGQATTWGDISQQMTGATQPVTVPPPPDWGNIRPHGAMAGATTGTGSGGVDSNNPLFQGINPQLVQYFVQNGITPTGRGTGPTDIAYLNDQMSAPGQDPGYWLNTKLPSIFAGGNTGTGSGGGGGGAGVPSSMPIGSGANQYGNFGVAPAPYTPQPFTGDVFAPSSFPVSQTYQPQPFSGTTFQPGQFTAPTGLTEQNDPGYQARLKMGTDALQNSAAARGSILSGGTLKALDRYAQDYASNEFGNVYNRALGTFNTNTQAGQLGYQNQMQTAGFNQNAAQQNYQNLMNTAAFNQQAGQLGFQNRYGDYLNQQGMNFQANQANIANQRNAQQDFWSQLNNVNLQGQNAAVNSYQTV